MRYKSVKVFAISLRGSIALNQLYSCFCSSVNTYVRFLRLKFIFGISTHLKNTNAKIPLKALYDNGLHKIVKSAAAFFSVLLARLKPYRQKAEKAICRSRNKIIPALEIIRNVMQIVITITQIVSLFN